MEKILRSINEETLLTGNTVLVQLIPVVIFSVVLMKISAKGKTKRLVPSIINFVIILFLNAMNQVNLYVYTWCNQVIGRLDIPLLEKLNVSSGNLPNFNGMNAINPVSILLLLLILDLVDAGTFMFCMCTFCFRLLFVTHLSATWIGWIILSIMLAFVCKKVNKKKLVWSYICVSACMVVFSMILCKTGLYAYHVYHLNIDIFISIFVLLFLVFVKFLKSLMNISSVFSVISKVVRLVVEIGAIILIAFAIKKVSSNINYDSPIHESGEEEEQVQVKSGEDANQFVQVEKGNSSSYLISSSGNIYTVDLSFDGDLSTCWQDGSDGDGSGESLGYGFDGEHAIGKICIYNGNLLSQDKYYANNRIQNVNVQFYQNGSVVYEQMVNLPDDYEQSMNGFVCVMQEVVPCDQVIMQVMDVYTGSRYNDLCLSEVKFYE